MAMWGCPRCAYLNKCVLTACEKCGSTSTDLCLSSPAPPQAETRGMPVELFFVAGESAVISHGGGALVDENCAGGKSSAESLAAGVVQRSCPSVAAVADSVVCGASVIDTAKLEERRLLLERLLSDSVPRWYEACIVLQSLRCSLECDEAHGHMAEDNSVDAFAQRNLFEKCHRDFVSTSPFVEFLQVFKHVSVFPSLQALPLTTSLRHCVQEWVESHNGVPAVLSNLGLLRQFQELLNTVTNVFSTAVSTSARTASEALLLAALTDICRYCIQVMCTCIPRGDCPFSGNTMKSVMNHNAAVNSPMTEEHRNHQAFLRLLVVARSTAYHRCSEDIQASVSPLVAELLSVFDMFSSESMVPLDKQKIAGARCRLSGVRLNPDDSAGKVDEFVHRYWEVAVGGLIPE